MDGLYWKILLKWMIWGYHYFWKPPNELIEKLSESEIVLVRDGG
jgi:hypothetical protein